MTQLQPSTPNPADDAIVRLLDAHLAAASEELAPSSGFVASVMESIHARASEPPPIAFPWRRALPGVMAILCGLLAFIVLAIHQAGAAPRTAAPVAQASANALWPRLALVLALTPREMAFGWILLATLISIAAVAGSLRLAGRSD